MINIIKTVFLSVLLFSLIGCKNDDSQLHFNQGFSYLGSLEVASSEKQRDRLLENAEKEFSLAIKKNPQYFEAFLNRGAVYLTQGKFNKAEQDYLQASKLKPNDKSLNYNIACLYSKIEKIDLALDALEKSLESGFDDIERLRNDADLDNLRKNKEFNALLEKHKIFLGG